MYDDPILSTIPNNALIDFTQEEVNEDSLLIYDKRQMIKCISNRISKHTLNYYIENIKNYSDSNFYIKLLREIINRYSLNNLKLFLNDADITDELVNNIIDLLRFIKIDLVEYMFINKLYLTDSNYIVKEDFLNIIQNSDLIAPYLFKWSMVYIDRESYDSFIYTIINESSEFDYFDDV